MSASPLDRIEELCASGADADDVLRGVVRILADEAGVAFAEVRFVDDGRLVEGPTAGVPDEKRRRTTRIDYGGATVGELVVDGALDDAIGSRIAEAISTYVLLGWDTGGTTWEP